MVMQRGFSGIDIPERPSKPRKEGITMIIDWGHGLNYQEDLIQGFGEFFDTAKIAVCSGGLFQKEYLKRKVSLYQQNDIICCPGGMFLELAYKQGKFEYFCEEAKDIGFQYVEVSDNLENISNDEKAELIRIAREKFGLKVFGEVGRKHAMSNPKDLVDDLKVCVDAGAEHVYIEAWELFVEGFNQPLLDELEKQGVMDKTILEMPHQIFPDVHLYDQIELFRQLIIKFGSNVNLANVSADVLHVLEAMRRGIFVESSNPEGAYALAGFEYHSET